MSKTTDLMGGIFIERISNDIDHMMVPEEELTNPYTYFPYYIDLRLVVKSACSTAAETYSLAHMTGALKRSQCSMNARHITASGSADILAKATCLA